METTSRYTSRPAAHYAYPQPPPSPPMDDTPKCSLPSISNLLVMADQGSPTTEHPPHSHAHASYIKPDTRPSSSRSSHYGSHGPSRAAFPPTPPMSSDTSFEAHHSPSAKSVGQASLASTSSYYYETTPPAEDVHRHQPSSYSSSPYYPSSAPSASGLMYQKPLPQNYQPAPPTAVPAPAPSSGANPWQHHHYISPSSAASFPQSQDRYICQTCNKAFSRPSSLRIHSHSHTGEKPFKCPHLGCGKAFSVRSNMKRHERGCHSLENGVHSFR